MKINNQKQHHHDDANKKQALRAGFLFPEKMNVFIAELPISTVYFQLQNN